MGCVNGGLVMVVAGACGVGRRFFKVIVVFVMVWEGFGWSWEGV